MATDFTHFPWIAPWQAISLKGREAYEYELLSELAPGHPLYGVKITAIGRVCYGDDVLFQLEDHPAELAVVHLTYTGRPEKEAHWPSVVFYNNLDHWVARSMLPDAASYEIGPTDRAA
ncbi:MAG: hypothetical protein WC859_02635 [Elusimicrobiota bacterium]|jgi:hypothetical protein